MCDDNNFTLLEGIVTGNVYTSESNGKLALNFTIESRKMSAERGEQFFPHSVVMFDPLASKMKDQIKNGVFVKTRGHLLSQSVTVLDSDGKATPRVIDKVVIDFCQFDNT
jgi:hypothetical protein